LQRANGDADQFCDFLAALAVLDQILDLLDALGRELDLTHFSFILFCVQRLPWGRLSHTRFIGGSTSLWLPPPCRICYFATNICLALPLMADISNGDAQNTSRSWSQHQRLLEMPKDRLWP